MKVEDVLAIIGFIAGAFVMWKIVSWLDDNDDDDKWGDFVA